MPEKTLSKKSVFKGRLIDVELQTVEIEGGRCSSREIVRHGPAVALIVQRPDKRFVFIHQFRKPIERSIFEVVAGNCEVGEEPARAAARELREETGYIPQQIEHLGGIFTSPGYCDERIEIYFAKARREVERDLDEDEEIVVLSLSQDEVATGIANAEIEDAKTLAAWQLYLARRNSI